MRAGVRCKKITPAALTHPAPFGALPLMMRLERPTASQIAIVEVNANTRSFWSPRRTPQYNVTIDGLTNGATYRFQVTVRVPGEGTPPPPPPPSTIPTTLLFVGRRPGRQLERHDHGNALDLHPSTRIPALLPRRRRRLPAPELRPAGRQRAVHRAFHANARLLNPLRHAVLRRRVRLLKRPKSPRPALRRWRHGRQCRRCRGRRGGWDQVLRRRSGRRQLLRARRRPQPQLLAEMPRPLAAPAIV